MLRVDDLRMIGHDSRLVTTPCMLASRRFGCQVLGGLAGLSRAGSVAARRREMSDAFTSAIDQLNRSADSPSGFSRPFLHAFPVSGAAVSTVGDFMGSETLSASDENAARLDELQFDLGEGPCWTALRSARPVLEPDLRNPRNHWPAFTAAATHLDVRSMFAFPVLVGSIRIGAVDLYSREPLELDRDQVRQAGAMADVVGRHVLRRAVAEIGAEDEATTPFSRRLVHQATGVVLAQLDISADDARLVLHGHAFAASRPVMEVAQDVIDGTLRFSVKADGIETDA
jgi:hypothetical protein